MNNRSSYFPHKTIMKKNFLLNTALILAALLTIGAADTEPTKTTQIIKSKTVRLMPTPGTVRSFSIKYTQILPAAIEADLQNNDSTLTSTDVEEIQPTEKIVLNTASATITLLGLSLAPSRNYVLDSVEPSIQKIHKLFSEKILTLLETKTLTSVVFSYELLTLEQKILMTTHLVKNSEHIHATVMLQGPKPHVSPQITNLISSVIADDEGEIGAKWIASLKLSEVVATLAGLKFLCSSWVNTRRSNEPSPIKIIIESPQKPAKTPPEPTATKPTTKFEDVAGVHEAKEALQDILSYLKNSAKYCESGVKPPRGVLLYGPPGTGKTLLAKALAGEAKCSFLSANGSDFSQKFVGGSAETVRKLFTKARKQAPCIVFIDELDSVGINRERQFHNPHIEQHAALTCLLTEMDGFETKPGEVIVIGATNRRDSIDPALLRPGRFDRHIKVDSPRSDEERAEVLEVHMRLRKTKKMLNVSPLEIARKTKGFSPAQLELIVNEATLIATKRHSAGTADGEVSIKDFDAAIDTVLMGAKARRVLSEKAKQNAAIRLAGEAALNILLDSVTPLDRVTLEDRDELGAVITLPREDSEKYTEEELKNQITELLGGWAAQTLLCNGKPDTGIKRNKKKIMALVLQIESDFYHEGEYSGATQALKIFQKCKENATNLLTSNRSKLEELIKELKEKETLYAADVKIIMQSATS